MALEEIINSIASLGDSIKESFTVLRDFLLTVELSALSLGFILIFLAFIILVLLFLSSPAFIWNLWIKQKQAIKDFLKNNDNPKDWLGKS